MLSDRRVLAGLLVLVLAAVAVVGLVVVPSMLEDDTPAPEESAEAFLAAWGEGDVDAMARGVVDPPDGFAEDYAAITDGLELESASYELGDVRVDENGELAIAGYQARLRLAGAGEWAYSGSLRLRPADGGAEDGPEWLVEWSPATIHPDLADGERLASASEWPERAPINGADGRPLVQATAGVNVGVQPSRIQDRNAVRAALQSELGVDPAAFDAAVDAPGVQPEHFVSIVTITRERYDQVRPVLYPIPGILFPEATLRAGPTEGYAQHILGRLGEVTAERLEELGAPYEAGDRVGMTGLEARFEAQLAGTPTTEVRVTDEEGEELRVLDTIEGRAPVPVNTTLDPTVQAAVESAIARTDRPAAIVVVDPEGNIRGAASRPLNEDLNRALAGSYPPGSTFKVVTGDALLTSGVTPESPVECQATATAGGRSFRNFEGGQLGTVPFGQAFAESCNTAFVTQVGPVDNAQLTAAAERFGFNAEYSVGLNTSGGSYPEPADDTEKAAQAIGQGRIVASPLHMATVAGAVMDGSWEPPTLLVDPPAEPEGAEGGATATTASPDGTTATTAPAAPAQPTTIANRDTLAGLMGRVVTEGSGTNAAVPGRTVAGKTGTAEFGSGDPLPTHAWFVGFSGNLAASVFLEGGGVGGRDAAPIAGALFASLPAG